MTDKQEPRPTSTNNGPKPEQRSLRMPNTDKQPPRHPEPKPTKK